ncbi:hypothetical protein SAMN05216325_10638 [Nitrosomonas marina]|uniref:Uncharacterized protein n=1 Tax=Nitrosomonas marina TaxID=917 RepID=A0A1H8D5J5_9PROT|nr:hypothetical protein SAMN05216325_10638 [Nitrosomonas marina]
MQFTDLYIAQKSGPRTSNAVSCRGHDQHGNHAASIGAGTEGCNEGLPESSTNFLSNIKAIYHRSQQHRRNQASQDNQ